MEMIDGGDVGGCHVGHGLPWLFGFEDAPIPAYSLDPFDTGPGEEGGGYPVGQVLEEGERSIGLIGDDVNEAVPGLK